VRHVQGFRQIGMARAKWWPATIHTRGNVREQITFVTLKISSTGLQFVPVCQDHPQTPQNADFQSQFALPVPGPSIKTLEASSVALRSLTPRYLISSQ